MIALFLGLDWDGLSTWAQEHLLRVVLILVVTLVAVKIVGRLAPRIARSMTTMKRGEVTPEDQRRAVTIAAVVTYSLKLLFLVIAFLTILSELGVDLTPLLASIGFVSVLVGLATQTIVRDYIKGFAILSGKYYVVGDRVTMGGVTGVVEELTLRRTVLRAADGATQFVAHSDTGVVTRHESEPMVTILRLAVPDGAEALAVLDVVEEAAKSFALDEAWKDHVISSPVVESVRHEAGSPQVIQVSFRVRDEAQWAAVAELQRRVDAVVVGPAQTLADESGAGGGT